MTCQGDSCEWGMDPVNMSTRRWYPTVEVGQFTYTLPLFPDDFKGLADGSVMIIGGNQYGGFVNSGKNAHLMVPKPPLKSNTRGQQQSYD
jgi:hypothetical protein